MRVSTLRQLIMLPVFLVCLVLSPPASARGGGHGGHGHGGHGGVFLGLGVGLGLGALAYPYYYPPPVYYPPPPVYYPPPAVYYAPPPAAYAPQQGSPASGTVSVPAPSGNCRRFNGDASVDASGQPFYGTACLQSDGRWHISS